MTPEQVRRYVQGLSEEARKDLAGKLALERARAELIGRRYDRQLLAIAHELALGHPVVLERRPSNRNGRCQLVGMEIRGC